jgi:hypothetical protein
MATLHRPRDLRISSGTAFGPATSDGVALARLTVATFMAGVGLGAAVGAGWDVSPGVALGLGGVLPAWLLLSHGSVRPEDG